MSLLEVLRVRVLYANEVTLMENISVRMMHYAVSVLDPCSSHLIQTIRVFISVSMLTLDGLELPSAIENRKVIIRSYLSNRVKKKNKLKIIPRTDANVVTNEFTQFSSDYCFKKYRSVAIGCSHMRSPIHMHIYFLFFLSFFLK